jgi:RNA polymerase sigma-70 factor
MVSSLAQRLTAALGAPPPSGETMQRIDALLASAVYGRSVEVHSAFPDHVARVVDRDAFAKEPLAEIEALALSDLALALAAVRGERDAVAAIERTVIEPLPRTLSRLRPTPQLVDELRQELREKLLVGTERTGPKLLDFRGRGPLGAWARVVALRAAYDRKRSAPEALRAADEDALAAAIDGADTPDVAHLRRTSGLELREAFRAAARRLDPEERAVLRAHAVDGLSIDQIGALFQIHRATAARWIQQAKASLLAALRDEVGRRIGGGSRACESVVALVGSRLDLSIERALREDPSGD